MYLLFIDEFGHENTSHANQSPIFGYGGFIIPAAAFSQFSMEYFDIKVAAFKPLYEARLRHQRDHSERSQISREKLKAILDRLRVERPEVYFRDASLRRAVATYEVKGSDVFSTSYIAKLARRAPPGSLGSSGRTMVRFAKWLMRALRYYQGEVFYVGFHRSQAPLLKGGDQIHLHLVRDVIDRAYKFAKSKNSVVKIIFDHHYSDVGPSTGPGGKLIAGQVRQSRADRAREIVMSKGYFEHLTEPVFNAKSHLSQGVQAADWICALLKIVLTQESEYRGAQTPFSSRIEELVLGNVADQAIFRMAPKALEGSKFSRQGNFSLHGGKGSNPNPKRSYNT
ncbi:DUF3800 domain-containing protein [Novosphingobium sediminis]|uniref:DUF3800 domain-containing protein n=1 Tax=Novosphingobium sediminis TaxID=707214 RepID=UPI0011BF9201|nr:DUF3800 domain-containing protein [Novosphingobium sediminis]